MPKKQHPFPRMEWTSCDEPPDSYRNVLVWHRVRPLSRCFEAVTGWWNTVEWRQRDSNPKYGTIYQPVLWKDIEEPVASHLGICPSWQSIHEKCE